MTTAAIEIARALRIQDRVTSLLSNATDASIAAAFPAAALTPELADVVARARRAAACTAA